VAQVFINPWRDRGLTTGGSSSRPLDLLHRHLPGYAPSPLLSCPDLAQAWKVDTVLVKDESRRFRLPAFKMLGASWAVYQLLLQRAGLPPETAFSPDVAATLRRGEPMRLVSATDGNHGRAVAHVARLFGLSAEIFLPAGSAMSRLQAIRDEGARVHIVPGDYDQACAAAAAALDANSWLVSDTFWPGHAQVPRWISEGYATMFVEIANANATRDVDAVFVPVGVGALAEAAIRHFRGPALHRHVGTVCVEPTDAACVMASLRAGGITQVPGPHRSAMVGLNCGTPSEVAWPMMRDGFDAAVSVPEPSAEDAMRALAASGIIAGGTGAASCAGAAELLGDERARAELGLDSTATILLLNTEGVTDPDHYRRVVATSPS
jgi:diaminopropionate ammonia-lyase